MSAKAKVGEREVEFWDYEVEVDVIPATEWIGGWGRVGRRKAVPNKKTPWIRVVFRGKGHYKSDPVPYTPRNVEISLMLPRLDAIRLAHAAILASHGNEASRLQKISLSRFDRKRALLPWKLVFQGETESRADQA